VLRDLLDGAEILSTGANLGFSGGCNAGIRMCLDRGAELVLLLNADAMVAPECVARLEQALETDADAGIAAPLVLHRSDPSRIASAGMSFHTLTGRMRQLEAECPYEPDAHKRPRPVAGVNGCAMLLSRGVFETVGLLDEDYFFTFEDLDLCLRARHAGMATICVGDAICYHAGSLAIGPTSPRRLYYATRNHLLAARRAAPLPWPLSLIRAKFIVLLNLAHALRTGWATPVQGITACLHGAWDHLRQRYGPAR